MKEMVPQVFNHKKEEQKTLTRAVGAFAKCKKGLKDGLKTTNGLVKKIKPATDAATQCQKDLTVAATAVTECTTSNKVFQNLANSECGAFQQFIKTEVATASSSCKLSSTADSFGLDAKRIVSYYSAVQTFCHFADQVHQRHDRPDDSDRQVQHQATDSQHPQCAVPAECLGCRSGQVRCLEVRCQHLPDAGHLLRPGHPELLPGGGCRQDPGAGAQGRVRGAAAAQVPHRRVHPERHLQG